MNKTANEFVMYNKYNNNKSYNNIETTTTTKNNSKKLISIKRIFKWIVIRKYKFAQRIIFLVTLFFYNPILRLKITK